MFGKNRRRPESLTDLVNTPPAVEEQPRRAFSSLLGTERVHANRWFITSSVQWWIIAVLAMTVYGLFPLKTVQPWIIFVDPDSGHLVGKPVPADQFRGQVNDRMIGAEARAFVRGLVTIDPFTSRSNLERVSKRVAGKAATEFKEFLSAERPFERLAKTQGLVRTAENLTVDASQKNVAFVFVQTAERISSGEPIITKWRFTLHYVVDPAVDPHGFEENPIGFVVTHFERVQDFQK